MFRLTCRTYFEREPERKQIPFELNNCPVECPHLPNYYDARRYKYCDECPHKIEKDKFRERVENLMFEFTNQACPYKFDEVLPAFYSAKSITEADRLDTSISVKTAELASIYRSEKNRADEIKDAEKPR